MARQPWTERTFAFDFPASRFPELLERLRGTPARVEDRINGRDESLLSRSDGHGWSIKQNVGHLIDLGYLPLQRIDQILAGESVLIAADMTNQKTGEANHNERPIADLLTEFRSERTVLVTKLESLHEEQWGLAALHPRIQQPMRIVDIVYFDSEHDDYHLARISELIGNLT